MTIQLSSIINGSVVVPVNTKGRLVDSEIAQCICNASVGALSTRQLLEHFRLFQADKPHIAYQSWAVEHGLWKTWQTKSGKVKPVGCNERKAELSKLGESDGAEARVLRQFDAIRVMFAGDKETAERLHKMDVSAEEKPQEKTVEVKTAVPALPPLVGLLTSQKDAASKRIARLLAQVEMDESLTWIADELKAIKGELEAPVNGAK